MSSKSAWGNKRQGKFRYCRTGVEQLGEPSVPFVDVAEGAAADEVTAAEPRLDGGRHRCWIRHPSSPRDPTAALGIWRSGIVAGFARRLPPTSRVWIRGGVRLALHTAPGSAHFERSRDLSLVPGLCPFVRGWREMVGEAGGGVGRSGAQDMLSCDCETVTRDNAHRSHTFKFW